MELKEQVQVYNRAKLWQIILFTFNNTSTNIYLFSYAFISYYSTGVVGLAVLFVSSLLGGIRFFDGAIDPFIGSLIDKTQTKFGRYRPIILSGNLITALSFIVLFSTHLAPEGLKIPILIISLLIHKVGYSLQASVTKAGQTCLTNDPKQRPLFAIFDGIFNIGVFTGGQIFIANYLQPISGGFTIKFFSMLSIIAMTLSFILAILAMIGISEKDQVKYFGLGEDTIETNGFKEYWKVIKDNRPLQMLCLSASLDKLAVTLISDAVIVVMLFGILLGNYALSGKIAMLSIIPDLLITFMCTELARRSGLKQSFKFSIGAAILSFAGMGILLSTLSDASEAFKGMGLPVIIFILLFSAAKSFSRTPTTLVIPMCADVSDYETAKSGRYIAGMVGTIFSFVDSLAASLGPVVVGWISAWMGFRESFPTVDTSLSPIIKQGTLMGVSILPVLLLMGSFLAMNYYSLDADKMVEVQKTIRDKKVN